MAILTARTAWTRRSPAKEYRRGLERLTPQERANVRRVLAHLTLDHGPRELARALGMTTTALEKARNPSRPQSPRLAYAISRILDVSVDAVLAGAWVRVACPHCGEQAIA